MMCPLPISADPPLFPRSLAIPLFLPILDSEECEGFDKKIQESQIRMQLLDLQQAMVFLPLLTSLSVT
jgi:hypothetical protein